MSLCLIPDRRSCALCVLDLSHTQDPALVPWRHLQKRNSEADREAGAGGRVSDSWRFKTRMSPPCPSCGLHACVCVCRMFLVRDSQQHAQCFVLSLCYQLKTKHYLVIPVSPPPPPPSLQETDTSSVGCKL